jgi:hypothetical protein
MITLVNGANSVQIPQPLYGYRVELSMSFKVIAAADGTRTSWDDTAALVPDKRTLIGLNFQCAESVQAYLQAFLNDAAKGRCETIILRLGATPTGFYPFGPDLGDVGDFTCGILRNAPGGVLLEPWLHFPTDLALTLVTAPAYSLPTVVPQGNFQIGTVTGLSFPQAGFTVSKENNWKTGVTNTGVPYSVDGKTAADRWTSAFANDGNASISGALLAFLKSTSGRGTDITIVAPDKFYMFGVENGAAGTYTTRLLDNKLIITHNRFDEFSIPLSFWMKAAA